VHNHIHLLQVRKVCLIRVQLVGEDRKGKKPHPGANVHMYALDLLARLFVFRYIVELTDAATVNYIKIKVHPPIAAENLACNWPWYQVVELLDKPPRFVVDVQRRWTWSPAIDSDSTRGGESVLPYLQTEFGGKEWEKGECLGHGVVLYDGCIAAEVALLLLREPRILAEDRIR